MNERSGRQLLVMSYVVSIAILTWSEIRQYQRWPIPSRYTGANLVYVLLGLATPLIGWELAGVMGSGMLLALMYKVVLSKTSGEAPASPQAAVDGAGTPRGEGEPR